MTDQQVHRGAHSGWHGGWLLAILLLALVVRVGASVWWQQRLPVDRPLAMPDSDSYWTLARAIARGEPYEYGGKEARVFRTPALPMLLAANIWWLGEGRAAIWGARALGAMLGTVSVGLVMLWTAMLFDARAARLAGLVAALYPGAILTSVLILSEMLFCPLMVGQLVAWTASSRSRSPRMFYSYAALAGLLAALAVLTRPSWLLFVPLAGALGLLASSRRRATLCQLAVISLTFCLVMLPWWIRNYRVTGHFVPTSLQMGASLYDGLNPLATGASNMEFTHDFFREMKQREARGELPPGASFEYELDRELRRAAWEWAWRHPGDVLRLAGVKLVRMWNVWPNDPQFRGGLRPWILALAYVPLLVMGWLGAAATLRRPWWYWLTWLPAVYFTLLHMIFVSSMRYREPAMLGLMVLAAAWAGSGWLRIFTPGRQTDASETRTSHHGSKPQPERDA